MQSKRKLHKLLLAIALQSYAFVTLLYISDNSACFCKLICAKQCGISLNLSSYVN